MTAVMTRTDPAVSTPAGFSNDDERWQAVVRRDPQRMASSTTRCGRLASLPALAARPVRRENVRSSATRRCRAGRFRPCKRCRSDAPLAERQAAVVAIACRAIEEAEQMPSLDDLAKTAGMSRFHFHRVFKSLTGVTPKAYADAHRAQRVRDELTQGSTVTEAIYGAGFNSNGRFYGTASELLGMTPTAFRTGGRGTSIRFAVGECWLGSILVAATDKGVCAISFGDDPECLVRELEDRFPKARLIGGDKDFERLVAKVVGFIGRPTLGLDLPLDVRGTAFQQRVWQALREIPSGSTASYAEVARRIGQPQAVRAVAQACASNAIAVAIPCHRVVRTDGALSGYRWGVERKRALLDREASE